MTQLQEAIRDKITKYSDACGMCTDTTKDCDTCGITCVLEDLNELQKLADNPDAVRPTAHWISVKDRPPVAKEVILTYESAFDSMSMAFRLPNTEEFINVGDYYALDAVTHWMPLPKPPKEIHND